MRRATGEAFPSPSAAGAAAAAAAGAAPSPSDVPPAGAAPAVISARGWPTATTSSGWTRSLVIVPLAGAGTSASTLSVETSMTVSPSATASPSALCHSRTVPSVTDSPISGMAITTPAGILSFASGAAGVCRGRGRGGFLAGRRGLGRDALVAEVGVSFAGRPGGEPGGSSVALAPFPEPLGSSWASTWPTATVSSTWAMIFAITPLAGAGTSASTLSVETSTTVSPSSTNSPSFLCHSRTTPSVTDSPIWGIWISTMPSGMYSSECMTWASARGHASRD